jgi:uncharacterized protein YggE
MFAVVALLASTAAHAQEMMPVRTISVTGQAERKVVPDEAHLNVNLNSQEFKLVDAKSAHDAKLNKLMAIVRGAGINEKKVATQSSSSQPVYRYENDPKTGQGKNIFQGYRVQSNLDITVEDTKKLADLMDQITGAGFEKGANTEWGHLLSTYYTISNPEKIRDDMVMQAIANAKAKAERMAIAAGASIARVYSIAEGSAPNFYPRPMPMMEMAKGAVAMDAAEAVAPPAGEQELTSTVTVIYELQ